MWELWVARTLCKSDLLTSSDSSSGKLFYRYVLQCFSVIWIRMFHKIKQETTWMTKNRGVIAQIMGFATTLWYAIKLGHYATKKISSPGRECPWCIVKWKTASYMVICIIITILVCLKKWRNAYMYIPELMLPRSGRIKFRLLAVVTWECWKGKEQ